MPEVLPLDKKLKNKKRKEKPQARKTKISADSFKKGSVTGFNLNQSITD